MADKDFLDKNGTSYLWNKAKQKIDAAKTTVDNYTINGKKVSGNPVLKADDVGAVPLGEDGKISSRYMPSYVDDMVELDKKFPITSIQADSMTDDPMFKSSISDLHFIGTTAVYNSAAVFYDNTLKAFILEVTDSDGLTFYFSWEEVEGYPDSADYGNEIQIKLTPDGTTTYNVITADTRSYYDEIEEVYCLANNSGQLIANGYVDGKIYVDTEKNKSYRWSGSQLVEVGGGVALGETSETAFAGDKGKEVYDAVFTKNMPVVVPEIVINSYSATDQSGNVTKNTTINGNTITIERGIKLSYNVAFRWNSANGYKDPTAIVAGTTWYDASKEKGGLPLKGVLSASKTGTTESALTLTAKVSAPKIGLMVDSNNNVTKAEGNDVAENSFKVSLTYRRYFGIIDDGSTINEGLIKGLSSELNTSRGKTIAINVKDYQQYVYAYESALNEASISKGVEDEKSFWTTGTLNITNQYGKTISYRYYVCGAGAYKGANIKFG